MRVDVCFVLSHGFAARMALQSDVLPRLVERGVSVGAILSGLSDARAVDLGRTLKIRAERAAASPSMVRGILAQQALQYFSEDIEANAALRLKYQRERATAPRAIQRYAAGASYGMNQLLFRFPRIASAIERRRRILYRSDALAAQLRSFDPTIVVATYPINTFEATVLNEAQRAGIPTVGYLLSWDNITSKGRFPVPTDRYISWGPIMTEEIQTHYGVPREHIFECGVSHFDRHHAATPGAIAATIESAGLDPSAPYLFFGMSAPISAPHEIDVVEWIAARVEEGAFGRGLQLLVRPHPQNVEGNISDARWLERLKAIRSKRVAVDYPLLERSGMPWDMKPEDMPRLADLIAGCAICMNTGSTISIDGMVHDKPVILTQFDAGFTVPPWQSARRGADYPHLAKLLAFGGGRVVRSFDELTAAIETYLADPRRDAEGRARARQAECGPCDGNAATRVADAVTELVARARRDARRS